MGERDDNHSMLEINIQCGEMYSQHPTLYNRQSIAGQHCDRKLVPNYRLRIVLDISRRNWIWLTRDTELWLEHARLEAASYNCSSMSLSHLGNMA